MEWIQEELNQLMSEYDATTYDVLNSDYSSFNSNLKRLLNLLENHPYFSYMNEVVLPEVYFPQWYDDACKTVKSMVGSGTLDWPTDRKEYLSMQLSLLNHIAKGNEDPPNLCSKFMYAGSRLDDCVTKVNQNIVEPFIRDYWRVFKSIADQAISQGGISNKIPSPHWHQRPLGIIILGLIVTIVGGLVVLKISGQW
ncbi:MAG: hypothetical protein PF450_01565 [Bacteroidales bacterium]|jgi:hypothetical protein|nr:hypothetical protein [Bacteroidales bacterium]